MPLCKFLTPGEDWKMKPCYKIAGLTVAMESFGRTITQAKIYRCDSTEKVDFEIKSPWEANKHLYPKVDDDIGEYLATGSDFYKKLLRFQGFMLHSSAVVVDEKAYLFTADSGTGKSTHTVLWLEQFGERAYILNDDKPALRRIEGKWYAFGTPWSGKHDISANVQVELAGIAILERSESNCIAPCMGTEAILKILRQANKHKDKQSRDLLLDLVNKLITEIPVWKLQCNMDPEAAVIAYKAMSQEPRRNCNEK